MLQASGAMRTTLAALLARYSLEVRGSTDDAAIPGSYWGGSEAGLIGATLYLRDDTPLHSALHEAAHYICMDPARRAGLRRDAGGDDPEECAVCYLQILLADELPGAGRARLCADMDEWGYSFRLASARAWFENDADDARLWLQHAGITGSDGRLTGASRC
jgi:hypothetical protein